MKKIKLNYRFHNPNTAEDTADYLLKIMMEANEKKVNRKIQEMKENYDIKENTYNGKSLSL